MAKPANASFEEAAALSTGALTALWLIRKANVDTGMSVLIYGASQMGRTQFGFATALLSDQAARAVEVSLALADRVVPPRGTGSARVRDPFERID